MCTIQDVGLSSSIGSLANHVKENKRAFSFHFKVVLLVVVTLPEWSGINRNVNLLSTEIVSQW